MIFHKSHFLTDPHESPSSTFPCICCCCLCFDLNQSFQSSYFIIRDYQCSFEGSVWRAPESEAFHVFMDNLTLGTCHFLFLLLLEHLLNFLRCVHLHIYIIYLESLGGPRPSSDMQNWAMYQRKANCPNCPTFSVLTYVISNQIFQSLVVVGYAPCSHSETSLTEVDVSSQDF